MTTPLQSTSSVENGTSPNRVESIPPGWDRRPLKLLLHSMVAGGTPDSSNPENWTSDCDGIPWVTIGDMTASSVIRDTRKHITPHAAREKRLRILPPGTLLYSIYASLGKLAVLTVPAVTNQAILGLIPNPAVVHQPYLRWWLMDFERDVGSLSSSNTQENLNAQKVRNIPVLLPPLEEQRAIADYLDEKTAAIDTLIAKRERHIELIEDKRQALVTRLLLQGPDTNTEFEDCGDERIGAIPRHWRVMRIAQFATKLTNGYVGPTRDILVPSGVPYLQSLHIKRNQIRFHPPYFVSQEWSQKHRKSELAPGDVLVVQTGDIGQVAVVPPRFASANCHALIIIRCQSNVMVGEYLSWVLNSNYGFHALKEIQTGALHPHLNCTFVRNVAIPVPPLDEQQAIIRSVRTANDKTERLIHTIRQQIDKLREYRQTLISAAVTGQLSVREEVPA